MNLLQILMVFILQASLVDADSTYGNVCIEIDTIVHHATVAIRSYGPMGKCKKKGTGFFISKNGHLITNWHVLEGANYAEVKTLNGEIYEITHIYDGDKNLDLILAAVNLYHRTVPALAVDADVPHAGDSIMVVAQTTSHGRQTYRGNVVGTQEVLPYGSVIEITTPVLPGASGSPVVNKNGKVVGVATYRTMNDDVWCYYAIPGRNIEDFDTTTEIGFEDWEAGCKDEDFFTAYDFYRIGLEYSARKDYSSALYYYEKANDILPDCALFYVEMGVCYERLGHYDHSMKAFTEALEIQPDCAEALSGLGVVLCMQDRHDSAAVVFEKVISVMPSYSEAYYNLGVVYNTLGRYDDAIEVLTVLASSNPDIVEVHNELGLAYTNTGDYAKAVECFRKALRLRPSDVQAHYGMGVALTNLCQFEEAVGVFEYVADRRPDFAQVYYNLGVNYGSLGLYTEEIDAYSKAVSINTEYADAYYKLAVAYAQREDRNSALQQYETLKHVDRELADQLWELIGFLEDE
jgi:tetratricopeptide (TPR) repeat protein